MPMPWRNRRLPFEGNRLRPTSSETDISSTGLPEERPRGHGLQAEQASPRPDPSGPAMAIVREETYPTGGGQIISHSTTFSGQPGESVERFVREFEDFAETNELSERDTVKYLLASLKGSAKEWWLCRSSTLVAEAEIRARENATRREIEAGLVPRGRQALTYAFLKEYLLRRYQTPHRKHLAQQELIQVKQGPGEKVTALAGRIQELGEVAFGHLTDEDRQDCLIHYFLNALTDRAVKLQVLSSKPETFEAAYETAALVETSRDVLDGKIEGNRKPSRIDGRVNENYLPGRMGSRRMFEREVGGMPQGQTLRRDNRSNWTPELRRENRSGWAPDGRPISRRCSRIGHMERDCRERQERFQVRNQGNGIHGFAPRERMAPAPNMDVSRGEARGRQPYQAQAAGFNSVRREGMYNPNRGMYNRQEFRHANSITVTENLPQSVDTSRDQFDELRQLIREQKLKLDEQEQAMKRQREEMNRIREVTRDPWGINSASEANTVFTGPGIVGPTRQYGKCSVGVQTEGIRKNRKRFRKKRSICRKQTEGFEKEIPAKGSTGKFQWKPSPMNWYSLMLCAFLIILGQTMTVKAEAQEGDKTFFICKPPRGGIPIQPPSKTECPSLYEIKGDTEYMQYQVWTVASVSTVKQYQCMVRDRVWCINSTGLGGMSVAEDNVTEKPLSVQTCRRIWKTKQWEGRTLVKQKEGVYTTNDTVTTIHSGCASVSNVILQEGTTGISGNELFSSIENMNGCQNDEGSCQTEHSTSFWEGKDLKPGSCPYQKEQFAYLGEKKGKYIRLYKIPQLLHITEGPNHSCLPRGSIQTREGIILTPISSWNKTTKASTLHDNIAESNLMQTVCELYQSFQTLTSLILHVDPTLGVRLAFQRNDIQAIWYGNILRVSECLRVVVEEHAIRYDHKIGNTCYYFLPVEVEGEWLFASPSGELFQQSTTVPCPMTPNAQVIRSSIDMTIPQKFYSKIIDFKLSYSLTDINHNIHSPLSNLPLLWTRNYQSQYARDYYMYVPIRQKQEQATQLQPEQELYFASLPNSRFEKLIQETVSTAATALDFLLDWKIQLGVNAMVVILALIRLIGCLCCCSWVKLCCKTRCKKRRNHRRTRLRELSSDRNEMRDYRRNRSVSVLTISSNTSSQNRTVGPTRPMELLPLVISSVQDYNFATLIDTGATISIANAAALRRAPPTPNKPIPFNCKAMSASGNPIPITHGITLPIKVGSISGTHFFGIVEDTVPYDLILGLDALSHLGVNKFTYDIRNRKAYFDQEYIRAVPIRQESPEVRMLDNLVIKPRSHTRFLAQVKGTRIPHCNAIFDPNIALYGKHSLHITPSCCQVDETGQIPVTIYNPTHNPVVLYRNTKLGKLTEAAEVCTIHESSQGSNSKDVQPTQDLPPPSQKIPNEEQLQEVTKGLPAEQASQLRNLLIRNSDVFAQHDYDLGSCNVVEHGIDTQDHPPIKMRPYRLPFAQREVLSNQINEMLRAGLIRPSNSPWAFPCILVKKKEEGQWRMVVDYRKLNKIIKVDQYRLPHIDDILYSLGKARIYSSLDMCSGYCNSLDSLKCSEFTRETARKYTNTLPKKPSESPTYIPY